MRLVGDIESDGFLEVMTTVHCIVLYDLDKQKYLRFNDQTGIKQHKNYAGTLADAVELHNNAKELYYHFGHGFDYPALKKIYPKFNPKVTAMFDTVTMAKAVYRDIKSLDFRKLAKGQYPEWFTKEQLLGTHKLRAWGVRLGELKTSIAGSDGETDWSVWTPEMEDYCEQDVRVTMTLLLLLLNEKNRAIHPFHCHQLDNEFQHCMSRQERQGFNFDSDAGVEMASDIAQKLYTSRAKLQEVFKPFYKRGKRFTPKRNNATQGYTAGVEFTKVELTEFSPASRPHIQSQLQKRYGWVPTEYGKDGNATVDDDTLKTLTYPTIPMIREYQMLSKRQGQVSTGKQAWLKKVNKAGKVHCRIDPMGTVSWRAAHFNFNLAQVPSVQVSKDKIPLWGVEGGYGADSRALFVVPEGMLLCGNDAAGLELRCLANRIAKYDGGAYTELVLNGDVHTANQNAIGLNFRSNAKTWIYAMLYGHHTGGHAR
jgi:DNA polymerase-1